ncbi:MAG: IPTL-CTERM sorting domain-containing protein [Candidatus Methylomirabilales bacterium]
MKRLTSPVCFLFLLLGLTAPTMAGPVILGGDDLDCHGSNDGAKNIAGWLYIEQAFTDLLANVTCTNDGSVAVLGAADSSLLSNNGGGAAKQAALAAGATTTFHDTPAGIAAFFANLANNSIMPAIINIPTGPRGGVANGLDASEEAELANHAQAIADFINAGCGVLAHTHDYGWLPGVLPGITVEASCVTPLSLTTEGQTAFPSLTNNDVSGGPCHNTFSGSLTTFDILATDSNGNNAIFGGQNPVIPTTIFMDDGNGASLVPDGSGWMIGIAAQDVANDSDFIGSQAVQDLLNSIGATNKVTYLKKTDDSPSSITVPPFLVTTNGSPPRQFQVDLEQQALNPLALTNANVVGYVIDSLQIQLNDTGSLVEMWLWVQMHILIKEHIPAVTEVTHEDCKGDKDPSTGKRGPPCINVRTKIIQPAQDQVTLVDLSAHVHPPPFTDAEIDTSGGGTGNGNDNGIVDAGDIIGINSIATVAAAACGNNTLDPGEECDDGNITPGDGCSATCTIESPPPVCGNNILEIGEECDDGNVTPGDGCSPTCLITKVIPTLSEWGLIGLICLLGVGILLIHRRQGTMAT